MALELTNLHYYNVLACKDFHHVFVIVEHVMVLQGMVVVQVLLYNAVGTIVGT